MGRPAQAFVASDRSRLNASRFDPTSLEGFYESYFQRANHPEQPQAFWIRYTVCNPKGRPGDAVGELWAIYFDGVAGETTALKAAYPIADCEFSRSELRVRVGDARLDGQSLQGSIARGDRRISWELHYEGSEAPLLLLQPHYYERPFPKAKALVGTPHARYSGVLDVDGQALSIDGWVGSQNHNWGTKHTDRYAWGQVAGFDNAPAAFLECSTARLKLGPLWTPWLTTVVLRMPGRELALNGLLQAVRAHGRYGYFSWEIESQSSEARVRVSMAASKQRFVGLRYDNPPGGVKTCLNTKLASCNVIVEGIGADRIGLSTASRAAFEIVTDDDAHGVPIVA